MDLQKLIMAGRVEQTVNIKDVGDIVLATPPGGVLQGEEPFMNVAQFIIKIGDQDVSMPEKKPEVVNLLKAMQVSIFAKLATTCGEMTKEQQDFVEGLYSKK
jgi:hypothetical protein